MSKRGLPFYTFPMPIVLHKPRGKTPLEVVSEWKRSASLPEETPVSYAGRLDPMAEGILLVLVGDECKKQREYTKLDKEYVVEVLLGISTDTGDLLGIPSHADALPARERLRSVLSEEVGTYVRTYPAFSSRPVNGKPLFMYALEGTLDTIEIPAHEETIHRITLEQESFMDTDALRNYVRDALSVTPTSDEPSKALGADFRIGTIRPAWEKVFETDATYTILTLRVTCGSGAYMRTLAERIGKALGTSACALSIARTKVGRYQELPFCMGFWKKLYR